MCYLTYIDYFIYISVPVLGLSNVLVLQVPIGTKKKKKRKKIGGTSISAVLVVKSTGIFGPRLDAAFRNNK